MQPAALPLTVDGAVAEGWEGVCIICRHHKKLQCHRKGISSWLSWGKQTQNPYGSSKCRWCCIQAAAGLLVRALGRSHDGPPTLCCLQYPSISSFHAARCFVWVSFTGCNLQTHTEPRVGLVRQGRKACCLSRALQVPLREVGWVVP
jgi:hypothetical protein